MENIFKIIERIRIRKRSSGAFFNGDLTIHANPKMVVKLINEIQQLFQFVDLTESIKSNWFSFEADNIILRFVNNNFLEGEKVEIINSDFYRKVKIGEVDQTRFACIFINDESEENSRIGVTESINYCVANNIKLKIVDNTLFFSNEPFRYIFQRFGTSNECIEAAGNLTMEMIKQKIKQK